MPWPGAMAHACVAMLDAQPSAMAKRSAAMRNDVYTSSPHHRLRAADFSPRGHPTPNKVDKGVHPRIHDCRPIPSSTLGGYPGEHVIEANRISNLHRRVPWPTLAWPCLMLNPVPWPSVARPCKTASNTSTSEPLSRGLPASWLCQGRAIAQRQKPPPPSDKLPFARPRDHA